MDSGTKQVNSDKKVNKRNIMRMLLMRDSYCVENLWFSLYQCRRRHAKITEPRSPLHICCTCVRLLRTRLFCNDLQQLPLQTQDDNINVCIFLSTTHRCVISYLALELLSGNILNTVARFWALCHWSWQGFRFFEMYAPDKLVCPHIFALGMHLPV